MLVDTQVVLWFLEDNPKLGSKAKKIITSSPSVFVSSVSILEIVIKSMIGKLKAPDNLLDQLQAKGFDVMEMTAVHADAVRRYPRLVHHDPFDRVILAQGACENMPLLTADNSLIGIKTVEIIDATI